MNSSGPKESQEESGKQSMFYSHQSMSPRIIILLMKFFCKFYDIHYERNFISIEIEL